MPIRDRIEWNTQFCRRPHCRKISVRQYYQKRVIFYPTTLQRTACKKCLFLMRDIIISS
ncbi:hypothetical protein O5987_09765 [Escherichia coli]|nr:hypothetical protein [Escherichia coli]